jgi:uncharacterized membrane protein
MCVFLLLFYVHHLASSIVSDTVVDRVGEELDALICRLLPEAGSVSPGDVGPETDAQERTGRELSLSKSGYVQAIDYGMLVRLACECDVVLTLRFRAGWHLLAGGSHVLVFPEERANDKLADRISGTVLLGSDRTPTQDLEFSIRQLVEVALRALSPGINDPYTAVAVIDRLATSMALVMRRDMEPGFHRDKDGMVRVVARPSTFTGLIDRSFNEIRQSSSGMPAVLIRLLDALADLSCHIRTQEQSQAIGRHAAMIAAAGHRSVNEEHDLMAISEGYDIVVAGLATHSLS